VPLLFGIAQEGVANMSFWQCLFGGNEPPAPQKQKRVEPQQSPAADTDRPPVPYSIDFRPFPTGDKPELLLPEQVGEYRRESIQVPKDLRANSTYANYRSGNATIFVELAIGDNRNDAVATLQTAKDETGEPELFFDRADPSFLKSAGGEGVFFAWTRGRYYFSAHAKGGQPDLDSFMKAFPY
jgi:hypothetical protein